MTDNWERDWPMGREIEYLGRKLRAAAYMSDPDIGCYAIEFHYADARGVLRSAVMGRDALGAVAWDEARKKRPEMFAWQDPESAKVHG